MASAEKFHIGDVLSITTGRLVSPEHMDGIYKILNHMTGEDLFTHQLGRAMGEARPYLFDQFPELQDADVPEEFDGEESVKLWRDEQAARFGEWFDVMPIPEIARQPHDVFEDLARILEKPRGQPSHTEGDPR